MYLLTFVTLVIALIGLYTQVLILQAANVVQQPVIASALVTWHTAAVEMAHSILTTNALAYTGAMQTNGCSLTFQVNPSSLRTAEIAAVIPQCPSPKNGVLTVNTAANGSGSLTNGAALPALNNMVVITSAGPPVTYRTTPVLIPQGYDLTDYQFYSILFTNLNRNYVLTFLPPPIVSASNPAPGNISGFPNTAVQLNMTLGGLMQQLGETSLSSNNYGYISTTALPNPTLTALGIGGFNAAGAAVTPVYPLPTTLANVAFGANNISPNNGIGIISVP